MLKSSKSNLLLNNIFIFRSSNVNKEFLKIFFDIFRLKKVYRPKETFFEEQHIEKVPTINQEHFTVGIIRYDFRMS